MVLQHRNTLLILSLGFVLILVPILILVAVAINRIQLNIEEIDNVVHQQNTKTLLISRMLSAARERSLLMLEMHLTDDAFLRDEKMLTFNQQGSIFAQSRIELTNMPLSAKEQLILEHQGKITQLVVPIQRQIVNFILVEDFSSQSAKLIIEQAVPMQNKVFEQLTLLKNMQKDAARLSFDQAVSTSRNTIITMSLLALAVFSMCIAIAIYLVGYISRSEKLIHRQKERAQVTLHSIGDAVITTDNNGFVQYLNNEAEHLTGWNEKDAKHQPIKNICSIFQEDDYTNSYYPVNDVIDQQAVINSKGNSIIITKDNHEFAIEYTASPIFNSDMKLDGTIIVLRNVTEMRLLSHQLTYQATHDTLTGLINRTEFERLTEKLIHESHDTTRHHSLCYVDLDQFKVINDTCGHQAGDELLQQLATFLNNKLTDNDILSRLGGDEFGIIFHDCSVDSAAEQLEIIRDEINSQHFIWDNKSFNISISAGLVGISALTRSLHNIFSCADSACYAAKEQGRNRVHIYREDDVILNTMEGEMQWVHRINKALDENRFQLYYQTISPLGDLNNNDLRCELLIRMTGENGEPIPPMAFIPSAERYNVMPNIDKWVIEEAMSIISRHINHINEKICHFSINLSAQSISDEKFLPYLKEKLEKHQLPAEIFCFEITETTAIANLSTAKTFMSALKNMGCKFSLDDFGSGLSSFEYLKTLPVDFLKIDGAFVKNLINDEVDRAMVQSINQVGHVMGIKTIAEFAENKQILEILKEIGIDYAQGYGIDRPEKFSQIFSLFDEPENYDSIGS